MIAQLAYVLARLVSTNTHALTALRAIKGPEQPLPDKFRRHTATIVFDVHSL